MSIKLYYLLASPPARSVAIVLKILNIPHELISVDLSKGEHLKQDFLKLNPQHTVPVLDDNNFIISDSHAINAYLVNKYGKDDKLYPKDPKSRAIVDHRLHFDNGTVFANCRNVVRGYLREKTIVGLTQKIIDNFEEVYNILECFLKDHTFIAGDEPTIADISIFTSLSASEVIWPVTRVKYPLLKSYIERCVADIPHLSEINEPGIEAMKKVLEGFNFKLEN